MDELTRARVDNLISLRQSLLMLLPVLIGGTIGLFFISGYTAARIVFAVLGIYFIIILARSLCGTIIEINQILYKKEKAEWKMWLK